MHYKNFRETLQDITEGTNPRSKEVKAHIDGSEKKEAMQSIADWKEKMKMVEAHIEFLQDKRLASMEKKLEIAEKKLKEGDYGWISRELFFNGDLF